MRLERRFAGPPRVLDDAARSAALAELDRDILAVTTQRTNDARLRTIVGALRLRGVPMWPPTPMAFKALAATLKMGRYASAPIYFSPTALLPNVGGMSWMSWRAARSRTTPGRVFEVLATFSSSTSSI